MRSAAPSQWELGIRATTALGTTPVLLDRVGEEDTGRLFVEACGATDPGGPGSASA